MHKILFVFLLLLLVPFQVFAQEEENSQDEGNSEEEVEEPMGLTPELLAGSLLQDLNNSGFIEIAAFGDSIARGVGDFEAPNQEVIEVSTPSREAGYPLRVELNLDLEVSNLGDPGERITEEGLLRFASVIPSGRYDVVVVTGGANDAIDNVNPAKVFRTFQTIVNIARASNTEPLLTTIPPTCCDNFGISGRIDSFNDQIEAIAAINSADLADAYNGFDNSCPNRSACSLINRPEGLHPNIDGYDIFGEIVTASLLRIDIFSPDGSRLLENALLLPSGSVATIPDPQPVVVASE